MTLSVDRLALLELDLDCRLSDLWAETVAITDWDLETAGAFMRAAYGAGYCAALTEPRVGSLCSDHNYRVPARRAA